MKRSKGFSAEEQAKIDAYLAKYGVTECPDSAAMVMGTTSPGWRWAQERSVDLKDRHVKGTAVKARMKLRDELAQNQRQRIADRMGVPVVKNEQVRHRKRGIGSRRQYATPHAVLCQFFDKECLVCTIGTLEAAQQIVGKLSQIYAETGARFYLAVGVPPTRYSWLETVKPLLVRQRARQRKRSEDDGDIGDGNGSEQPDRRVHADDQVQLDPGSVVSG